MKIRTGFVSNSSSASFIVEVKGKHKNVFYGLYENVEAFSTDGCIKLMEKQLEMLERFQKPKEDASEADKNSYQWDVDDLEKTMKEIKEYEEKDWRELREATKKEKDFQIYLHNKHREKTVKAAIRALRWEIALVDDGYLSINAGGPCCYNGWENIVMHKELVELVAFFTFMKYDVRTRIESHEGSF